MYFGEDEILKFDLKVKLIVVVRIFFYFDIFVVVKDGRVYFVLWVDGSGWKFWRNIFGDNDWYFLFGVFIIVILCYSK